MRLAIIGPVHPYRGGVSQFNTRLTTELAEEGDDVQVLSWRRQYPGVLYPGGTQLVGDLEQARSNTIHFELDYRSPASIARTVRRIRRFRPDAIILTWTTTFTAPYYLLIMAMLKRAAPAIPILAICHNVLPHEQRPFDEWLARAVLDRVGAAVVHSAKDLDDLGRIAPSTPGYHLEMPEFGPLPISDDESAADHRRQLGRRGRVILFFGMVRPYKGLDQLVEAMALLDPALDVLLLIAGQFWEPRGRYDELIARHGLGERIRIIDGYVDDADVGRLFAAADAVVLPYLHATQSAVVPLAFAHNRPVISTAVGGIPELVRDGVTGLLVPPGDPAQLAEAIDRFFRHGLGRRLRRGIAARDRGAWRRYTAALRRIASTAAEGAL